MLLFYIFNGFQIGVSNLPVVEYQMKMKLENRICRQIQDLHANFWHKREKEAQRSQNCTYPLLQGVEIELIFALPCVYGQQFEILLIF